MALMQILPFNGMLLGLIFGPMLGRFLGVLCFSHHGAGPGGLIGLVIGVYGGYRLGCLPFEISMRHTIRELQSKSTDQLWKELYEDEHAGRDILMMLKLRGEPMAAGLGYVLMRMDAQDDMVRRWAYVAFLSAFRQYERAMEGYQVDMPETMRHQLLAQFRAMLPDEMQFKCDL